MPRTSAIGPAMARTAAVVIALVSCCGLAACGTTTPEGDQVSGKSTPAATRPIAMEKVIAELEAMRAEMFAGLDARFGKKHWRIDSNEDPGIGRSGCADNSVTGGEIAYLPNMGFDGTFPEDSWQEAFAIVRKIGTKHGFHDVATVVDQPNDHEIEGHDDAGAHYVFTMARTAGILIRSGCHAWDRSPGPGNVPE